MPRIEERKHRIAARFGAAESYEAAAKIQRVCADQLAERICAAFQTPPGASWSSDVAQVF